MSSYLDQIPLPDRQALPATQREERVRESTEHVTLTVRAKRTGWGWCPNKSTAKQDMPLHIIPLRTCTYVAMKSVHKIRSFQVLVGSLTAA
jgi:hypothetical protein